MRLIFLASVFPWVSFVRQEPFLSMMSSVYVTLGIFLLLAVRNPSANRNLIAFTACSSFAHAALMGVQTYPYIVSRGELAGVALTRGHRCCLDHARAGEASCQPSGHICFCMEAASALQTPGPQP